MIMGGQIPAFLLRSSHTGRKFIPMRRHLRRFFALSRWASEIYDPGPPGIRLEIDEV